MTVRNRERHDLSILIFLVPLGILLIIIVGQMAVRMVPFWNIKAGMGSNLEPDASSSRPFALLEPIMPQILTPMAWAESYLTPDGEIDFPPFLTFEPSATPSPTDDDVTPTSTDTTDTTPTTTSTVTATSTETVTVTATGTQTTATVTDDDITDEPTVTPTVTDTPTVTVTVTTTDTPTATPTDTPTATPTDTPTATPTDTPTATPTGTPSTLETLVLTEVSPTPVGIGTDGPDDVIGDLPNDPGNGTGTYTVVNISGNPVVVLLTPDGFYDMVFYESDPGIDGTIFLDNIIIGITNDASGATYYEVFNWGNNIPDSNSNVDTTVLVPDPNCTVFPECDNRIIPLVELYTDPSTGISTGILIDVDSAIGAPPADMYNYIIIISPNVGDGDFTQIDAIVVTEIAIPTPSAAPEDSGSLPQTTVEESAPVEINPTPSLEEIITEIVTAIEDLVTPPDTDPTPSPEEIITELAPTEATPAP